MIKYCNYIIFWADKCTHCNHATVSIHDDPCRMCYGFSCFIPINKYLVLE